LSRALTKPDYGLCQEGGRSTVGEPALCEITTAARNDEEIDTQPLSGLQELAEAHSRRAGFDVDERLNRHAQRQRGVLKPKSGTGSGGSDCVADVRRCSDQRRRKSPRHHAFHNYDYSGILWNHILREN